MDKMIKGAIVIGILLVTFSVSYYFFFALPAIQKQKLTIQAAAARLEQDQKCSRGAKAFFEDSQWSEKDSGAWYENHFNSKLNRCFILVHSSKSFGNSLSLYKLLMDVNDGTSLGEYDKIVPFGAFEGAVKPTSCEMLDKHCSTEEEFDAFIKTYMQP